MSTFELFFCSISKMVQCDWFFSLHFQNCNFDNDQKQHFHFNLHLALYVNSIKSYWNIEVFQNRKWLGTTRDIFEYAKGIQRRSQSHINLAIWQWSLSQISVVLIRYGILLIPSLSVCLYISYSCSTKWIGISKLLQSFIYKIKFAHPTINILLYKLACHPKFWYGECTNYRYCSELAI